MIAEFDLGAEFVAARNALTPEHKRRLRTAGVPSIALDVWGLVGVAKIEASSDRFALSENGREVFLVPVRVDPEAPIDVDHPAPAMSVSLGDTVDLAAFDLERPDWFATITGLSPVLGAALFSDNEPTMVWRSPLGWLQAKCRGVVPLTTDPVELRAVLERLPSGIVAEDLDHARQLREVFAQPRPSPSIHVRRLRAVTVAA